MARLFRDHAGEVYQGLLDRGFREGNFLGAVEEEGWGTLPAVDVQVAIREAWRAAIRDVDKHRTGASAAQNAAQIQFRGEGWPDPPSRVWKISDVGRVESQRATPDDHIQMVQSSHANRVAVDTEDDAKADGYFRLAPYYARGAQSVAEAVSLYQAEHQQDTGTGGE